MELEFNKEQLGNLYNIEMSEEFFEGFEENRKLEEEQNKEFEAFLKDNGINL